MWPDAYCVTLFAEATPSDVLDGLGAAPVQTRLEDAEFDPDNGTVGVSDAGAGWVTMAELNGFVGVTERLIGPLAGGRTIVSNFRNINGVRRLHWWRDGRLLVDIDLLFPTDRFGADPVCVDEHLLAAGVPLDGGDAILDIDLDAAGFSVLQRLTGVACNTGLFEDPGLRVATVPMPSHEEQSRYGEALHATWSAPRSW